MFPPLSPAQEAKRRDHPHPFLPHQSAPLAARPLDESVPTVRETADHEELAKRETELKLIDLDKNPYHAVRLEIPQDAKYPRVLIEGRIEAPKGNDGNMLPGFDRECYNIKGFALLDGSAETCFIVSDILGVDITSRRPALFHFTYFFQFAFIANISRIRGVTGISINTAVKIVPRENLPSGFEHTDIIIGQNV